MMLKNETYDILKKVALYILPAITTLVISFCKIWNLPYGAEIGATIGAIDTALGAMLQISSNKFNKEKEEEKKNEV